LIFCVIVRIALIIQNKKAARKRTATHPVPYNIFENQDLIPKGLMINDF
jgi:hypothetical protein